MNEYNVVVSLFSCVYLSIIIAFCYDIRCIYVLGSYYLVFLLFAVLGLQIQCSSSEFIIGERVVCSCSSHMNSILIEWYQGNTRLSQWYYSTEAIITIPVTTNDEGSVYTCLVISFCDTQQKMMTLNTKGMLYHRHRWLGYMQTYTIHNTVYTFYIHMKLS